MNLLDKCIFNQIILKAESGALGAPGGLGLWYSSVHCLGFLKTEHFNSKRSIKSISHSEITTAEGARISANIKSLCVFPQGSHEVIGTWFVDCKQFLRWLSGLLSFAWLFHIPVFVFWNFASVGFIYWQVFSSLFLSFRSVFYLSLSPLFSLSLSLFLPPFIIRFHQYSSTPSSPPLFSISVSLSCSPLISHCFCLIFSCFFSLFLYHAFSFFPLPPFLLLSSTLPDLFLRPHSHVDDFGGGPRRDRRGSGCHRLYLALPPHRPRQIPHQTQRSLPPTNTDSWTHGRTLIHACTSIHRDTLA